MAMTDFFNVNSFPKGHMPHVGGPRGSTRTCGLRSVEKTEALNKYAAQLGFAWRRAKKWLKEGITHEDDRVRLSQETDEDVMLLDLHS